MSRVILRIATRHVSQNVYKVSQPTIGLNLLKCQPITRKNDPWHRQLRINFGDMFQGFRLHLKYGWVHRAVRNFYDELIPGLAGNQEILVSLAVEWGYAASKTI